MIDLIHIYFLALPKPVAKAMTARLQSLQSQFAGLSGTVGSPQPGGALCNSMFSLKRLFNFS